ncbi:hypothetical protein LMG31506_05351 [Cupriavidus yeoncheonensis]|uniref:Pirin N-terminal domain-containing protein n=1 Tax=Cupriavidus yeoncheonensis TaxID=1462994 RepID=A0A916N043_9BURK|nr:pirin family protein [Cupriavidus yeoncheonensis]CAG2155261.1 hypothetical protein LMG31506_05351 [Cupriavidus yeoncheonensis]
MNSSNVEIFGPVKGNDLVIGSHFNALNFNRRNGTPNPLLMVDHFRMRAPTFGPHPHAGFSAITYVFEDSSTAHQNRDSIGNLGPIRAGALHWMVAGSGVVHDEWPANEGAETHGMQIFVDLPPELKSVSPYAIDLHPEEVPVLIEDGLRVRVVAGKLGAISSPIALPQEFLLLDCFFESGTSFDFSGQLHANTWLYVVAGEADILLNRQSVRLTAGQALAMQCSREGAQLAITSDNASQLVLMSGAPVGVAN